MPLSDMQIVGPLVAFGVIGTLALLLHWAFAADEDGVAGRVTGRGRRDDGDYGLLRTVATVDDRDAAGPVRAVLADAGIRSTVATCRDGVRVLVFDDELEKARHHLAR